MPITVAEIRSGAVAYLDASTLNDDPEVTNPEHPTTRNGPFVCFAVNGQRSGWAPISTQFREERLLIEESWRLSGAGAWRNADQYLNDGLTTYVGPNASFAGASQNTDTFRAANRPRVNAEGVAAILAEIQNQGGNVP